MLLPSRNVRRGFDDINQPGITQVSQSEIHRVAFRRRAELVHKAFVSKGILDAQRRAQGSGEEWRQHRMGENALTANSSTAITFPVNAPGTLEGASVDAVVKLTP